MLKPRKQTTEQGAEDAKHNPENAGVKMKMKMQELPFLLREMILAPVCQNLLGLSANNNQVGDFLGSSLQAGLHLEYEFKLRQLPFFQDSSEPDPEVGLHPPQFWQS